VNTDTPTNLGDVEALNSEALPRPVPQSTPTPNLTNTDLDPKTHETPPNQNTQKTINKSHNPQNTNKELSIFKLPLTLTLKEVAPSGGDSSV
jgi:hypothetical protein